MLFPEEDTPDLRAWIVKRIENTSDADSDVLADYVIALLKHDGDLASVRKLCEEEIPDFLTEDPKAFLDDVFRTIAYKSYKPGAPAPPPPKNDNSASNGDPASSSPHLQSGATGSRKRGFDEREDFALPGGGGNAAPEDRPIKKSRRGIGRRGRRAAGRGGRDFAPPFPMVPQLDPLIPMESIRQMQAMGMIPPLPGQETWGWSQRRKRCRDFDSKGYCSRGATCLYEHAFGDGDVQMGAGDQREYDPGNASLVPDIPQWQMDAAKFSSPKTIGRTDRRMSQKKRGKRAPFSTAGPMYDRSRSTIVVENIPADSLSTEKVTEFFSQFGKVESVSMQPYRSLALVKFDTWDAANAAYDSPKVIFDNRFVKVFWHKERDDYSSCSGANGSSLKDTHMPEAAEPEPELDIEDFKRKQQDAQRLWDEKEAKRAELEHKRQELDKQQQELVERHKEESEKLQARLAEKNGGSAGSSGADLLRAKLAELEQEAKILGIDPDVAENAPPWASHPPRGEPRGRGGAFRGRGYVPQRRGAFRGVEGRHAAYAQYSLDNRPKKLSVTGADFTQGQQEEVLRHFLLNLGEFESVDTAPGVTHVSFSDRKTAEKFFHSLHGKELSGVEGTLELQWVGAPKALSAAKAGPREDEEEGEGEGEEEEGVGGALERNSNDREKEEGEVEEGEINMDYDTAADEAWDQ